MYQFLIFALGQAKICGQFIRSILIVPQKKGSLCLLLTIWMDPTVNRYLTPPSRFRDAAPKKLGFASRVQVEEFVKREFPDVDPSTFFSMFIWKIPAEGYRIQKG